MANRASKKTAPITIPAIAPGDSDIEEGPSAASTFDELLEDCGAVVVRETDGLALTLFVSESKVGNAEDSVDDGTLIERADCEANVLMEVEAVLVLEAPALVPLVCGMFVILDEVLEPWITNK